FEENSNDSSFSLINTNEYLHEFVMGNTTNLSLENESSKSLTSSKLESMEKFYLSYIPTSSTNNYSFYQIELVDTTFRLDGLSLTTNKEFDLTFSLVK
ncbi:MAG: hypothetical protein SWZ49_10505, partial [Cyanobacteriota bacterium]|nr:hypothetical protein [Cyanobacteriota bacterium]